MILAHRYVTNSGHFYQIFISSLFTSSKLCKIIIKSLLHIATYYRIYEISQIESCTDATANNRES